jgi:hypothetical protein
MRVTHKAGAPYDYRTPRPTRDRDFTAQRILLICGCTIRSMIGSIGALPLLLTQLDQLPTEIPHLVPC